MGIARASSAAIAALLPPFCKPFARRARATSQKTFENLWALAFTVAGWMFHQPVEVWSSGGGQRILVIAPHPDDEAIGCAGTILLHKQSGDTVCVAYITDGRKSEALGLDSATMAAVRKKEAEASAEALRIDRFEWVGLPEGEWGLGQLAPRLRHLLTEFSPHVIYAPSRIDVHREHHKIAHALAEALFQSHHVQVNSPRMRIYQVQVPLTPVLVNFKADTSSLAVQSMRVLNTYPSQIGSTCRARRKWRYAACFHGAETHQEEFWEMSAGQYWMLHKASPDHWPAEEKFQVIEFRPYSDPRAYLKGLDERQRLALAVQGFSQ